MLLKCCAKMIETGLAIPEVVGLMIRRGHIGRGMDVLATIPLALTRTYTVTPNLLHSQCLKFEYE